MTNRYLFITTLASTLTWPLAARTTTAPHDHATREDIVDTAVAAGSFKTLVAAIQAAGLVRHSQGHRSFTVFAPNDAAFAKLPAGTVDSLLKPENKAQLQAILTYHVVAGKVTAADVVKLTSPKRSRARRVDFGTGQTVKINDAMVVTRCDVFERRHPRHRYCVAAQVRNTTSDDQARWRSVRLRHRNRRSFSVGKTASFSRSTFSGTTASS